MAKVIEFFIYQNFRSVFYPEFEGKNKKSPKKGKNPTK